MTAPLRFRVWCLSWDDKEEYGSDVVSYDILDPYPYPSDRPGVIYVLNSALRDAKDAAEVYADHAHDQRDGCEVTWPLVFRVRSADGSISDFEVDRDFVTEFHARPVKKAEASPSKGVPTSEDDGALAWITRNQDLHTRYRGEFIAVSGPPYAIAATASTLAELMEVLGNDDVSGLYFHQVLGPAQEETSP